jgi:hypothetical protein
MIQFTRKNGIVRYWLDAPNKPIQVNLNLTEKTNKERQSVNRLLTTKILKKHFMSLNLSR